MTLLDSCVLQTHKTKQNETKTKTKDFREDMDDTKIKQKSGEQYNKEK